MHQPYLVPLVLIALSSAAGAVEAAVRIDCRPAEAGPCAAPPAPPAPPAPLPQVPTLPAIPAIPAPPPPPAPPEVPAQAHAACAGKASGSTVSLQLGPRETMSGLCEREGGKMVFQLRSYRLDD